MSHISSPTDQAALAELRELFGTAEEVTRCDPKMLAAATLAAEIRGRLVAAMQADHVNVTELAKRLGVSKSAVSRHLNSDGDIRITTAALLAHALGREWKVDLLQKPGHSGNYKIVSRSGTKETAITAPSVPVVSIVAMS